jgi:hypothetical protein
MNQPVIVWSAVVACVAIAFIVRGVVKMKLASKHK